MTTYKSQQYEQMNYTLFICAHTLIIGKNGHMHHTLNTVQGPDSPEMSRLARAKTTDIQNIHTTHTCTALKAYKQNILNGSVAELQSPPKSTEPQTAIRFTT